MGTDCDQGLSDTWRGPFCCKKRACLVTGGGTGEHGGQHLDHQRQCAALRTPDGQHRALKRGLGIGGRIALDIKRPAFRDILARLVGVHDLAPGNAGQ